MQVFNKNIIKEDYIIVKYYVKSKTTLKAAAWAIACGQSIGNPNDRSVWETEEMFEKHSCMILQDENVLFKRKQGYVKIGFPVVNINFDEDGISQLLCFMMGGNLDIDIIQKCIVVDVEYPKCILDKFKKSQFGLSKMREFTQTFNKPLLGGIIKPKTGITSDVLLDIVKELVEGGVQFIKEDEILSNPAFCPIEERVPKIMEYLKDKNVVYSVCINSDPAYILERAKKVAALGGNSIHVNFWSGLGVYKSLRELNLPLFIHFQKSGDKILTNSRHDFHIDWNVVVELACLMGVDTIHVGMLFGYSGDKEEDIKKSIEICRKHNVVPTLSCGLNPGNVNSLTEIIGVDYLANVGGAIHGNALGTRAGTRAMCQAIDGKFEEPEYKQAIKQWGKRGNF